MACLTHRWLARWTAAAGLSLLLLGGLMAQDGGGGFPTDPGAGGGGDVIVPPTQTPVVSGGTDNGGVTAQTGGEGDPVDFSDAATLDLGGPTVDNRNQGFIGAQSAKLGETGFVGAPSSSLGPALAEGAGWGGGVNDQTNIELPGGGGGGGGGGRLGGGFTGAAQNGFTVTRRNLRARLMPLFDSPEIDPQQTVSHFANHMSRQPTAQGIGQGVSIQVKDRTAEVTGNVASQLAADRIIAQLRLQPGVYKINNRLVVTPRSN